MQKVSANPLLNETISIIDNAMNVTHQYIEDCSQSLTIILFRLCLQWLFVRVELL